MKKLKIGDLAKIRDKVRKTAVLRQGKARAKITVHMGTCGIAAGARSILSSLLEDIRKKKKALLSEAELVEDLQKFY